VNLALHGEATLDEEKTARPLQRALREIVETVLPAVLIAVVLQIFVVQAREVNGYSMEPTLYNHERVIMEKVTYRFTGSPRRGDVVVLDVPGQTEPLIKRVVALPGETVAVQGGQVFINGEPLSEPWAHRQGGPDYPPTLVLAEHVFVLGDNRPHSGDSRYFGPVRMDRILGRACFIYWPPSQAGTIR